MDHLRRRILYHYTDFQALDGILRCAQLRVNNGLRMNDSAEMKHFMNRLCAAAVDRLEGSQVFIGEEALPVSRACRSAALAALARTALEG